MNLIINNTPTMLGAAALATPHPGVKAVLSTSSVVIGVVQDIENGNVNNSVGSFIGLYAQEILEKKIPITQEIAPLIGFGASEAISRNMEDDDVQE